VDCGADGEDDGEDDGDGCAAYTVILALLSSLDWCDSSSSWIAMSSVRRIVSSLRTRPSGFAPLQYPRIPCLLRPSRSYSRTIYTYLPNVLSAYFLMGTDTHATMVFLWAERITTFFQFTEFCGNVNVVKNMPLIFANQRLRLFCL
jgi:hypothetical protein